MKYFKHIKKKIVSIIIHFFCVIFPLFFFIYFAIFILKKTKNNTDIINDKRILFSSIDENQKFENICKNVENDLFSLYEKESYNYINIKASSLKKSTSLLLDYLEKKNEDDLKKYFYSFYFAIFLLFLDIAIIFVWIGLCCFLYNDKCYCHFNKISQNICLKRIYMAAAISMYFLIIILNINILFQFYSLITKTNNSFCSLFKIIDHTFHGEEKNYKIKPKWIGIDNIKNLLEKTKNELDNIIDRNKEIYDILNKDVKNDYFFELKDKNFATYHLQNFCDFNQFKVINPNPLDNKNISNFLYCEDILNLVQNEYNDNFSYYISKIEDIYNEMNSINSNKDIIEFTLGNAQNKIDSFANVLKDIEIEYFNDLIEIYDIIQKYIVTIFYILFIIFLIIDFFGFFCISSLLCCNSKSCKKLFIFMLNIQMISLMIIILFSAFFSICCVLLEDISMIIKHSIFEDKNDISKTFYFSKNQYDIEGANICISGNGNLKSYTQIDKGTESLTHFYSMLKIIKDNLNNLLNYKIILEKNETNLKFNKLDKKPYLAKYQVNQNNNGELHYNNESYLSPEILLENVLTLYTNDGSNQNIGNNSYYANYFFVHSHDLCSSRYNLSYINITNCKNECQYQKGKKCMMLEDFPDNNYFNGITIKKLGNKNEEIEEYDSSLYNLDELTKEFKRRYYDLDNGFKTSFRNLLNNSKQYIFDSIKPKSNNMKNSIKEIYKIINEKINILENLYEDVIGKNNIHLYSIFNCKYLKRDINIFLNQIEINLYRSFYVIASYSLSISFFSFLSILFSILVLKMIKVIEKEKDKILEANEVNIFEKPNIKYLDEKYRIDTNLKSNENEKVGLKDINNNLKKKNDNNDNIKNEINK